MVRNTTPVPRKYHGQASSEHIRSEDLMGTTLTTERFLPIFEIMGNKKTAYGPGIGPDSRDRGTGWSDLDLQNSAGSPIDAKLRWEIYDDPERENLIAYSSTFAAADLRAAVAADRTEKRLLEGHQPLAGDDSYLVLAAQAKSGSDGDTVSSTNSAVDVGVAYSRYK